MIKLFYQLYLAYIQTGGELVSLSNQFIILFGIATFHFIFLQEFFKLSSNTPKILLIHLKTVYYKISFIRFWSFKMLFQSSPIEWINVPRPPFLFQ